MNKYFTCILFLAMLPLFSVAEGICLGKEKNKEHCRDKGREGQQPLLTIEEYGFLVPPPSVDKKCISHRQYHQAIINFYQWYLDHKSTIVAGLSNPQKQKDWLPPFNVSYQSLHRFYKLIRRKYPNWISQLSPNADSASKTRNPEEHPASMQQEPFTRPSL